MSLEKASFADALDATLALFLSKTKVATEKRAEGILSSIGSNPGLRNALIGAGAGGLGGALMTVTGDREKNRGKLLRNMALGSFTGAALGGGSTLLPKVFGGGGRSIGEKLSPNQITDSQTGEKFTIDPKALKQHPEIAKRVGELTQEGPLYKRLPYTVGKNVWDFWGEEAPTSRDVLPWVFGGDLALNQRVMPFGDVLKRIGLPSKLAPGAISPTKGTSLENFRRGIGTLGKEDIGHSKELLKKLMLPENADRTKALLEGKSYNQAKGQFGWTQDPQGNPIYRDDVPKNTKVVTVTNTRNPDGSIVKGKPQTTTKIEKQPVSMNQSQMGDLSQKGFQSQADAAGIKGELKPVRRLGGREQVMPTGMFRGGRGLGRLGLYGGIPLLESGLRDLTESQSNKESLRDLLRNSGLLKKPTEG